MFLNSLINSVRTVVLAALLIVSFSTLAPARPVDRATLISIDLSQYTLPDGNLPIICFGNGASETVQSKHCDDCISGFAMFGYVPHSDLLIEYSGGQLATSVARLISPANSISERCRSRAPPTS